MEYTENQFPRCTYYTGSRTATQAMLQLVRGNTPELEIKSPSGL